MTVIRLLGKKGVLHGFEVSGHTGAGTEGNDLVCAAVSFLAVTMVNALESVAGEKPRLKQAEALIRAELTSPAPSPQALTILKTFRQGAKDLQTAYPEHVRLVDETI